MSSLWEARTRTEYTERNVPLPKILRKGNIMIVGEHERTKRFQNRFALGAISAMALFVLWIAVAPMLQKKPVYHQQIPDSQSISTPTPAEIKTSAPAPTPQPALDSDNEDIRHEIELAKAAPIPQEAKAESACELSRYVRENELSFADVAHDLHRFNSHAALAIAAANQMSLDTKLEAGFVLLIPKQTPECGYHPPIRKSQRPLLAFLPTAPVEETWVKYPDADFAVLNLPTVEEAQVDTPTASPEATAAPDVTTALATPAPSTPSSIPLFAISGADEASVAALTQLQFFTDIIPAPLAGADSPSQSTPAGVLGAPTAPSSPAQPIPVQQQRVNVPSGAI